MSAVRVAQRETGREREKVCVCVCMRALLLPENPIVKAWVGCCGLRYRLSHVSWMDVCYKLSYNDVIWARAMPRMTRAWVVSSTLGRLGSKEREGERGMGF